MNKTAKNIIIRVILIVVVLVFVVLTVVSKSKRDDISIAKITIQIDELQDNFLITKDEIYARITKKFTLQNQNIDRTTLQQIESYISEIPQVEAANCFINNKSELIVIVKQRQPIARIYNRFNENFYIDKYGVKFAPKNSHTANVPIVYGNISEDMSTDSIQTTSIKNSRILCNYINNNKNNWQALVGQIYVNENQQLEVYNLLNDSMILFGDAQNLEEKFQKLSIFFTEVLAKVGWNKYRVINIMYKDQIICLK